MKRIPFIFILLAWFGAALIASAAIRTVTNTADGGVGSLRDTIAASAAGDTIQFSGSIIGTVHIVLTSSNLFIGRDLTINANGRRVLIDGGGTFRVFLITAGTVNLIGLTITNGFDNSSYSLGSGVYNSGFYRLQRP